MCILIQFLNANFAASFHTRLNRSVDGFDNFVSGISMEDRKNNVIYFQSKRIFDEY